MPSNVAQKLMQSHLVDGRLVPGEEVDLKIDQTLTQDATSQAPGGRQRFKKSPVKGESSHAPTVGASYCDVSIKLFRYGRNQQTQPSRRLWQTTSSIAFSTVACASPLKRHGRPQTCTD